MIENQQVYIVYVADGVQTQWDFPYPYVEASEIELFVEHDGEVSKIDSTLYSFDEDTKKVTYPLPLDANFSESLEPLPPVPQGDSVLLWRNTAITQEEDSSNTNFKSPDVERMVDKLTAICQELSTLLGRTVRYSPVVPDGDMETDALKFVEGINQSMQVAQEAAENAEDAAGLAEQAAAQAQAAEQAVDGAVNTHNQDATAHPSIQQHLGTIDGQIVELQNTKYAADIDLSINSSTFVVTTNLKDQDGNIIGTAKTIDLPLESVVVSGSYDAANKKVVLTLQNGSTIEFSVADLVAGLQSEITSSNKLSADLVDDTNTIRKFVTASDKTTWNGKQNAIADLETIRSGATAGTTALQPDVAASTYATKAEIADQYTESNLVPKVPVAFTNAQVSDFYTVVGSPIIVDGVVSNFSLSSYVQIPAFMPGNKTWALQLKFKLNSSMTNSSALFNDTSNDFRCPKVTVIPDTSSLVFRAFVSTTGSSWNVSSGPQRRVSFDYSKWAYILWEFTGSQYILSFKQEGQDYSIITTINSTEPFYQNQNQVGMSFGGDIGSASQYNSYIDGSIDLNETYIKVNGEYFVPPLSSTVVSVSAMTGATSSAAGTSGLVPAPAAGDETKFLRGDGTWVGSTSSVAWGSLTGTLSDQTDLQTALNAKANDSDVVHKTGAETINGVKTYINTSDHQYSGNDKVRLFDNRMDKATVPAADFFNSIIFGDTNKLTLGTVSQRYDTNGASRTRISADNYTTGTTTNVHAEIWVQVAKDGTVSTYAPTPATSDNSTKIATTAFVKSQTHLIETYVNGTSWYNVWEIHNPSTGALIGKWCEQGGLTSNLRTTVTLLKKITSPFTLIVSANSSGSSTATATSSGNVVSGGEQIIVFSGMSGVGAYWHLLSKLA